MLRLIALVLLLAAGAADAKSLALVIGNDAYAEIPALQKARADAAGYAAYLRGVGFDVTLATDVDARGMTEALATFLDRIAPGDTVAFVWSGHGWSDGRQNFLVATDIRAKGSETLLARESFALRNGANGILDEIAARGPGLTLAIIDACRNNPFVTSEGTRSVGLGRGLAPVAPPTGTFIAFSAGEGQTALDRLSDDDPARFSVFTRVFLEELEKPQDLQAAFKATQLSVNDIAASVGHAQRPAYYDEVIGSACLSGACVPVAAVPSLPMDPVSSARREWEDFRSSTSVEALKAFAERHKATPYAPLALERIRQLEAEVAAVPAPRQTGFVRPDWCSRAATASETAICASEVLATLDLRLGRAYAEALARRSGSAASLLRIRQQEWLVARDACGADRDCLRASYEAQILYLLK
jgi:uncharacterized protein YecT (DUF1311 family)